MKSLKMIIFLVLTSCASIPPSSIKDVRVGDELEYINGGNPDADALLGCKLTTQNINTVFVVDRGTVSIADAFGTEGIVCGPFACREKSDKYACFGFRAFQAKPRHHEPVGRRTNTD
jgi:hypothetical protein